MERPRPICHVRAGSQRADDLVRRLRSRWPAVVGGQPPRVGRRRADKLCGTPLASPLAVRGIVDDDASSASLRSEFAFLAEHADEVLGRWAAVMLASEVYAEVIDRHVELGGDVAWIAGLFDAALPVKRPAPTKEGSQQPGRGNRERAW